MLKTTFGPTLPQIFDQHHNVPRHNSLFNGSWSTAKQQWCYIPLTIQTLLHMTSGFKKSNWSAKGVLTPHMIFRAMVIPYTALSGCFFVMCLLCSTNRIYKYVTLIFVCKAFIRFQGLYKIHCTHLVTSIIKKNLNMLPKVVESVLSEYEPPHSALKGKYWKMRSCKLTCKYILIHIRYNLKMYMNICTAASYKIHISNTLR